MDAMEQARERVELAQQHYLFCSSCGQPMDFVCRNGELWMECRALAGAGDGLRYRLSAPFHDRHWVANVAEEALAEQPLAA